MNMGTSEVRQNLESKLSRYFGVSPVEATAEQMYKACAMTIRDILATRRKDYKRTVNKQGRQARVLYVHGVSSRPVVKNKFK